ncbi:unnamed protein product [Caenorhabditis bovis]|uniref:Chondroitin proteoglycan 4 domain-containing protein n=1 Tax=Caenorhabditis bovis TaxID=2654633 RepID=A0A8S1EZ84_9PELO|nr:unnamed protein product [Caenorhabditis bovis]
MRALSLICISVLFAGAFSKVPTTYKDKDTKPEKIDKVERLDHDVIFRALGVPFCMRKCIDSFINTTTTLWTMSNVVTQARSMCSAHAKSIACLKTDQFCDVHKIFNVATSSVEYMCAKKFVLFERMEKCLEPVVDDVMKQCDKSCYARSNLTAFSKDANIRFAATVGGNVFIVTDHLGELCGSLQCTLPCVTKKLNQACPLSGWLALDMLLQPLDAAATMIDNLAPAVKDLIGKKIDKRCRFAIHTTQLNRVRNGDFSAFQTK